MSRQPILPKADKGFSQDANAYRKALHDDLYPKTQVWTPATGNVTSGAVVAEYTSVAKLCAVSILFEGPTTAVAGAFVDLPFAAGQHSVFSVAVGGVLKPAIVEKGSNRLYLPDWNPSGRAVISGIITG